LLPSRTDGAEVHDVHRQLVVERMAGKDIDFGMVSAVDDLQLGGAADLARERTQAHDAAIGEQRDAG
jgi:hypothetical protein